MTTRPSQPRGGPALPVPEMDVQVIGWGQHTAVAYVAGIRCTITRGHQRVTWTCAEHGSGPGPETCLHLQALSATEADPTKEVPTVNDTPTAGRASAPSDCTCRTTDVATVMHRALEGRPQGCPWHDTPTDPAASTEPTPLNSPSLQDHLLAALTTDRKRD